MSRNSINGNVVENYIGLADTYDRFVAPWLLAFVDLAREFCSQSKDRETATCDKFVL